TTVAPTRPVWGFPCGTYRADPAEGHEGMTIGLEQFRDERVEWLPWMLLLPFVGRLGGYPVNRRGESDRPEVAGASGRHPGEVGAGVRSHAREQAVARK